MIFYVTIKHKEKQNKRAIIEALTLIFKDNSKIDVEWESSDWSYGDKETYCRLKGILFNEKYANENLSLIKDNIKEIKVKAYSLEDDKEYNAKVSYLEVRDAQNVCIFDLEKEEN